MLILIISSSNHQFMPTKYKYVYFNQSEYFFQYYSMLFGSLLEAHSQNGDNQLVELQRELKSKIERAKNMINNLQATSANGDDTQYATTSAGDLIFPQFNASINYNEEFWKTYLKNEINFALIKQLTERTSELQELVKQVEHLQQDYFRLYKLKNRKKNRRLAVEIEKKHECPYEKCYKFYGSDVSLNLHIKLKHNGGNKTDRQKLAEQICLAEVNKGQMPELRLNLPPGYLEEYRKNHFLKHRFQSEE